MSRTICRRRISVLLLSVAFQTKEGLGPVKISEAFHGGNTRRTVGRVRIRASSSERVSSRDLFCGDLGVQPTYLHKHDAPLCFPFSLRAPALHLREKMRERGAVERRETREGRRRAMKKGRELRVGNPILRRRGSRYFDVLHRSRSNEMFKRQRSVSRPKWFAAEARKFDALRGIVN